MDEPRWIGRHNGLAAPTLSFSKDCEWDRLSRERALSLLSLAIARGRRPTEIRILCAESFAPNLRHLTINELFTTWWHLLPVTPVEMSSSGIAFKKAMGRLVNLEKLTLSTNGTGPIITPGARPLHLPRLTALTIFGEESKVSVTLCSISAPILAHLTLRDCDLDLNDIFGHQTDVHATHPNFPSVTHLSLWNLESASLSCGMPSITHIYTTDLLPLIVIAIASSPRSEGCFSAG